MAAAIAAFPGFLSIEFIPGTGTPGEWHMVLQFRDPQSLAAWQSCRCRDQLHEEARGFLDPASALDERAAPDLHAQGSVTEVVTSRVRPEKTAVFLEWSRKIQQAQAGFPGYRGFYLQAPSSGQRFWTTLIRFATQDELEHWLASPERRRLVAESGPLVEGWSSRRLTQPFAGWFPAREAPDTPPNWQQAMVVLLVLFPIVMLELRLLTPLLRGLNTALGTFIGNLISVGLLTWPAMPIANRALDWWLRPVGPKAGQSMRLGTALLVALYIVEIAGFTWLV